eukprot:1183341-Prorocentrum_minimum.AAC.1
MGWGPHLRGEGDVLRALQATFDLEARHPRLDQRGAKGERSGRKWGTGQGGEKRGRVSGVLSASLPSWAQEDR